MVFTEFLDTLKLMALLQSWSGIYLTVPMEVLKDGESTSDGTGIWISTLLATLRLKPKHANMSQHVTWQRGHFFAMCAEISWGSCDLNCDLAFIMYLGVKRIYL